MSDDGRAPSLLRRNPVRGRFLRDGDPAVEPASILNIANVISIVRILFIPAMLVLLVLDAVPNGTYWAVSTPLSETSFCFNGAASGSCPPAFPFPADGPLRWWAAALFIVAIATDWIDGRLARSRRLVTDFGIFLDPVADKGLTGAALIGLSIIGELWWWVTALILLREIGITVWRAVALRDRVIPAGFLGKLKTTVQGVAIGVWLLPIPSLVGSWFWWVDGVLMAAALVLTLWSGVDYLVRAARPARPAAADR